MRASRNDHLIVTLFINQSAWGDGGGGGYPDWNWFITQCPISIIALGMAITPQTMSLYHYITTWPGYDHSPYKRPPNAFVNFSTCMPAQRLLKPMALYYVYSKPHDVSYCN